MLFSLIKTAWAVANAANTTPPADPLSRFGNLGDVLGFVMNVVFYVGIAMTIIFLIMGGLRYVTSGGSKEGTEAARGMITSAVIGFIVVVGAFAIKTILVSVLGVSGNIPTTPPF